MCKWGKEFWESEEQYGQEGWQSNDQRKKGVYDGNHDVVNSCKVRDGDKGVHEARSMRVEGGQNNGFVLKGVGCRDNWKKLA